MDQREQLVSIKVEWVRHYPFHINRNLRILYLLEGTLELTWVSGAQLLKPGEIEIINVEEPVKIQGAGPAGSLVLIYEFQKEFVKQYCPRIDRCTYNCNCALFFSSVTDQEKQQLLQEKLRRIYGLYLNSQQTAEQLQLQWEIRELSTIIDRDFNDVKNVFSHMPNVEIHEDRFLRINDYLLDHLEERITLQDIADSEYLSLQYLSKEFNEKLKRNFQSVLEYYRMIRAVRLILTTSQSVTAIGQQCGYSASRYFYRAFQSFMGVSPTEFKQQQRLDQVQSSRLPVYDRQVEKHIARLNRQYDSENRSVEQISLYLSRLKQEGRPGPKRLDFLLAEIDRLLAPKGEESVAEVNAQVPDSFYDSAAFGALLVSLFLLQKDVSWLVQPQDEDRGAFLSGQSGLLTWDGLPKPSYWALVFIRCFGQDARQILLGKDYGLARKENGECMLLLNNCPQEAAGIITAYRGSSSFGAKEFTLHFDEAVGETPETFVTQQIVGAGREAEHFYQQLGGQGQLGERQRDILREQLKPEVHLNRLPGDQEKFTFLVPPYTFFLIHLAGR